MDRRTILALVLMAIVFIVTPILFPSSRPPAPASDSTRQSTTTSAAPRLGRGGDAGADCADERAAATPRATPSRRTRAAPAAPSSARASLRVRRDRDAARDLHAAQPGRRALVGGQVHGYRDLRPGSRDTVRLQQGAATRTAASLPSRARTRHDRARHGSVHGARRPGRPTTFVATNPAITHREPDDERRVSTRRCAAR